MSKKRLQISLLGCVLLMISSSRVFSQDTMSLEKRILMRDSLDYTNYPLSINTSSNEFSPVSFKGGLLYISNKTIPSLKAGFNKIYWSNDPNYKIVDDSLYNQVKKDTVIKYYRNGNTDDFTSPTSNDNDILVRYFKQRQIFNEIELSFLNFSTEQVFSYDERTKLIIYAKKGSNKFGGEKHWELWQANLINGSLRNKARINFEDRAADYLHPFVNEQASKLYFASNRAGGKGGYDLYYVPIENNNIGIHPISLVGINSTFDEIMPSVYKDTTYFSSNKEGGLGGFDAYESTNDSKIVVIKNMGYPVNSEGDDVGLKKIENQFYMTSNRTGNFDILKLKYEPAVFTIVGSLAFNSDNSLLPSQIINVKDKATATQIETIKTDAKGNFIFNGKPNRTYELSTMNGNGDVEFFSMNTDQTKSLLQSKNLTQNENYFKYNLTIKVGGLSVKQKADSVQAYIVKEQRRVQDSLMSYGLNGKFIVHYAFNKHNIALKEQFVLDSLLNKLNHTPKAYVVIGGFTDCIGSYKYNLQLSIKRGKAVAAYLFKHGLDKKKIVLTGYSKKYNISPCVTKYANRNHALQQDSRRSEVVLSETKNTNWETLEKLRGANYYTVYSSHHSSSLTANTVKAKTILPALVKKDTVIKSVVVTKPVVKKDTITKMVVAKKVVVKQDTLVKSVVLAKPVIKKDTVIKVIPIDVKVKDTIQKKAEIKISKIQKLENSEITKEEILKVLDSLAKLKIEQERIVSYLTMRINNKPIDIYVSSDTVTVEIYDSGVHDRDSVSVIYNNRIIVDRQELKVNQPIKFKLKVDKNMKNNELIMVAENLGTEPPNTAVIFITEKSGKRQQVILNTDMTHNGVVYFIRIGKQ